MPVKWIVVLIAAPLLVISLASVLIVKSAERTPRAEILTRSGNVEPLISPSISDTSVDKTTTGEQKSESTASTTLPDDSSAKETQKLEQEHPQPDSSTAGAKPNRAPDSIAASAPAPYSSETRTMVDDIAKGSAIIDRVTKRAKTLPCPPNELAEFENRAADHLDKMKSDFESSSPIWEFLAESVYQLRADAKLYAELKPPDGRIRMRT